ncbi:MAG: CotH kinase family protein [Spirosomataceae bacterium]
MKCLLVVAIYLCQTITLLAQVKINELMASNATTLADNAGDYSDWIELYNSTDNPIDLAGYYLTDNYANLTKFRFTTTLGQVVVPAKGYLIVWASSAITKGVRHTNFSLSATGEQLALVMADGVSVVDSLSFDVQRKDVSFGRLPDGGSTFKYFASPTPNINNSAINSFDELLSSPLFSQVGGFYSNSFTLHITHPDTAVTIYYTTDGSIPTAANLTPQTYQYQNTYPDSSRINDYRSFLYESSLLIENPSGLPNKISNIATTHSEILDYLPTAPIEKGKIIRAIATKSGALSSEIVSNSYFFSPSGLNKYTLPVISVMSQEDGFFSFNDGIYVPGVDFEHWRIDNPTEIPDEGSPSNYRREGKIAERTAHFEIIETDTVVYKQAVGIRINGGWSRAFRVKSLRLYGTDEYNTISYPLLPQLPYSDYKTMILRNAGNDYSGTLFRDALVHGSVAHLKIDIQEYRPSILFLNGEYWGIHNIRQRQDKHYYSQKYGVNKDSLDIIGDGIEEGSDTLYQSMLNYILDHDLADSTHYNYVTTQMDVESFMDYQITEIFYNNQDWGVNNIKYWRLKTPYNTSAPYGHDGKWRWSLYDADATISNWTEDRLAIASSFTNWEDAGFLLGKLLQNQNFKCKFINRFADLINTCFLTSHLTQLIQNKRDAISRDTRPSQSLENITR